MYLLPMPSPLAPSPLHFDLKAKVFRLRAQDEGGGKVEGRSLSTLSPALIRRNFARHILNRS
jgi:hypothetical protein